MNEKHQFVRPDLTGENLGGVELFKKIGGGGFGDVYISPDYKTCVKVIFRGEFESQESYDRELNAVQCISSCVQGHCGIIKFMGGGSGGFNYQAPFSPHYDERTQDFEMYWKYPVLPDFMEWECRDWKEKKSQDFFYYLMVAADNLAKPPEYCPDTLENRCRRGILAKMSDNAKIFVIAEIIDSLLFLYKLEVKYNDEPEIQWCELQHLSHRLRLSGRDEVKSFHITHGDIKPANIFFVNGHAQLGDMGATMQIDPDRLPSIGTPEYMPNDYQQAEMREMCGNNYCAYSIFCDLYALGKTARYMLQNGREEVISPFSKLSRLIDQLQSFTPDIIPPEFVVEKLTRLRARIRIPNHFGRQSYYGTSAPDIRLKNLAQFTRGWQIVEAESENRFRVTNHTFAWRNHIDILLAERFPGDREAEIREKESAMLRDDQSDGCPILIFQLKESKQIIVLSHSSAPFRPSEEALRLLQQEIAQCNRRRPAGDDSGFHSCNPYSSFL